MNNKYLSKSSWNLFSSASASAHSPVDSNYESGSSSRLQSLAPVSRPAVFSISGGDEGAPRTRGGPSKNSLPLRPIKHHNVNGPKVSPSFNYGTVERAQRAGGERAGGSRGEEGGSGSSSIRRTPSLSSLFKPFRAVNGEHANQANGSASAHLKSGDVIDSANSQLPHGQTRARVNAKTREKPARRTKTDLQIDFPVNTFMRNENVSSRNGTNSTLTSHANRGDTQEVDGKHSHPSSHSAICHKNISTHQIAIDNSIRRDGYATKANMTSHGDNQNRNSPTLKSPIRVELRVNGAPLLHNNRTPNATRKLEMSKEAEATADKDANPAVRVVPNEWTRLKESFEAEMQLRRHDNYIADLEVSALDHAGPTIRAIYDGDEHEKFMERLESRVRAHDKDIERMCNAHYQGFVDCIHALLQVRPQAHRLKREIESLNRDTGKSAENVIRKADELIRHRRILVNAELAMDTISVCIPIMEKFHKLELLLEDRRYEHALKTLEDLEKNSLPRVSKYRWAAAMVARIPEMREEIKKACMAELKDFLEAVRQATSRIGELAMRSAAAQRTMDDGLIQIATMGATNNGENDGDGSPDMMRKSLGNSASKSNNSANVPTPAMRHKKRKAPAPPNPFNRAINEQSNQNESQLSESHDSGNHSLQNGVPVSSDSEELAPTDLVNFKPVYRCQFIFQSLGAREEFETYYRTQRTQQARLALSPPSMLISGSTIPPMIRDYFASVIGFFVIEDYLLKTGQGLVTKNSLNEQWQLALETIVNSLRTHSSYCTEAEVMLQIKRLIILLAFTLQSYGYSVTSLHNLLVEIQDHYNELLLKQWAAIFKRLFEEDNYHPIQVNSQLDYFNIMQEFPFYEPDTVASANRNASPPLNNGLKSEYPKRFPFSSFVPHAYREMKNFIKECLKYSQDLSQLMVMGQPSSGAGNAAINLTNQSNQLEVEEMIRKATNMLLTKTLGGCLNQLIRRPNLGLLQLIQITINTNYLEEACIFLEEFIAKTIVATLGGAGISATPSTTTPSTAASTPSSAADINHLHNSYATGHHMNPQSSPHHVGAVGSSAAVHLAKLQGKSMFKDIRSEAESQIYMQLNMKIDEFMELANYDWLMSEPTGTASAYITDLIAFLRSTFQAFTNLPDKVAQTACLSACKHVSSSLIGLLISEHVTAISWGAFSQFNLDLIQCELFAASEPVKGFEEGSLGLCFAELRQLLDLFLAWDWSTYLSDYGKNDSKYLRVNPAKALVLLEKMWEAENAKKNFLTSLKKNERDRKKLIDTVVRQLKALIEERRGGGGGSNVGHVPPTSSHIPPAPVASLPPPNTNAQKNGTTVSSTSSEAVKEHNEKSKRDDDKSNLNANAAMLAASVGDGVV